MSTLSKFKPYKGISSPFVMYDKRWYTIKLIFASLICAIALAENSKEGVIGTMLISPIAIPIVGMVTALLACQWVECGINLFVLVISCIFLIACGYVIGLMYKATPPTTEMRQRYVDVTIRNTIIAFLIGVVLSMAVLSVGNKNGFGITELVGAAIAIAILPPLVNSGLTYSNTEVNVSERNVYTWNSFKLAMYNIVGLAFGTIVAFVAWNRINKE